MSIKIKIWEIRNKKGMSLRELSAKTGISLGALNNYENGKREITIQKLEIIAQVLECKIVDLFESDFK